MADDALLEPDAVADPLILVIGDLILVTGDPAPAARSAAG
jgi:hypothetical protein